MMLFDPVYWIMLLPAMILAAYAQGLVKSRFNKFSEVSLQGNITGYEVARYIMENAGIQDVSIQLSRGALSDHYNPLKKTLNLSENVYRGKSIAAAGIAAHEVGHAIQHQCNYAPLRLRNSIVPLANLGSQGAPILILIGFLFNATRLIELGIVFFSLAVVFYLITLPVEFNASKRATQSLQGMHLVSSSEMVGVKKVLNAAALTYVAAALTAIMQLLYFLTLARRR